MADLAIYGARFHQTVSDEVQGGLIDLTKKILITNLDNISNITLVSSDISDDSQIYRIKGITTFDIKISELIQLNGIIPVTTHNLFTQIERITRIDDNPTALNGVVTVSDDSKILGTLESGSWEVIELLRVFAEVPSNPTLEKRILEKFFIRNQMSQSVNLVISEIDPYDIADFFLDHTVDSDLFSASRHVRPSSIPLTDVNSLPKSVVLAPGEAIGIWLRATIDAGDLMSSNRYYMKLSYSGTIQMLYLLTRRPGGVTLADVINLRTSHATGAGLNLRFVELAGAKMVEESYYEPNPITFRDQFYYNTRINQLFKKIGSTPNPVWKSVK